jgi:hypothetical protein
MLRKLWLLLVFAGVLAYGLLPLASADESGMQSCMTYCRLNFGPLSKPSEHARCVERCKREHRKETKSDWDRPDKMK